MTDFIVRVVNENNKHIQGAMVSLEIGGTPTVDYTDKYGVSRFSVNFSNQININGRVRVDANGYETDSRYITLSFNNVKTEEFRLREAATRTPQLSPGKISIYVAIIGAAAAILGAYISAGLPPFQKVPSQGPPSPTQKPITPATTKSPLSTVFSIPSSPSKVAEDSASFFSEAKCKWFSSDTVNSYFVDTSLRNEKPVDVSVKHQIYTSTVYMFTYPTNSITVTCQTDAEKFSKLKLAMGIPDDGIGSKPVMTVKVYQGGTLRQPLYKDIVPGTLIDTTINLQKNNSGQDNIAIELLCQRSNKTCDIYFFEPQLL
ncbi:hypothetical protein [Tolypothrix sp. VBCCA 56010]|uniref:hypothetical protein n=1 Tax=Tolypothrix sp. VBCCA 56010 TaxID=3137731 RepID=UPI003D7C925B